MLIGRLRCSRVGSKKRGLKIRFKWKLPWGTGKLKCFRHKSFSTWQSINMSFTQSWNYQWDVWACLYCHGNNFHISETIVTIVLSSFSPNSPFPPFHKSVVWWQQLLHRFTECENLIIEFCVHSRLDLVFLLLVVFAKAILLFKWNTSVSLAKASFSVWAIKR